MPAQQTVSLEVIDIARPCPADWDAMRGNEQVRFCKHCSLNVYNLSAMSRQQAERLVAETEGRLCVRFYRRLDGTVVTADCGGGWRLAAKKLGRLAQAATAVVLTAVLAPLGFSRWLQASPTERASQPTRCVIPDPQPLAIMGDVVQVQGGIAPPAKMGEMVAPLMGSPAPLPPTTQPAQQPSTRPAQ